MKKISLLFLFLSYSLFFTQTLDLVSLASGKYLGLQSISYSDKSLFGYVALYDLGKTETDKKKNKLEYFVFDKNLNTLSSGTFEADETALEYYSYINSEQEIVLTPSYNFYDSIHGNSFYLPSEFIISTKDYKIQKKKKFDYDGTKLTSMEGAKTNRTIKEENKNIKNNNGFRFYPTVFELESKDILTYENKYESSRYKDHLLKLFNPNLDQEWQYNFFEKDEKSNSLSFYFMNSDKDVFITKIDKSEHGKHSSYFEVFDIKTGKILNTLPFEQNAFFSIGFGTERINNMHNSDNKLTTLLTINEGIKKMGFLKVVYDKEKNDWYSNEINFSKDVYPKYPDIKELKSPSGITDLFIQSINFLKNGETIVIFKRGYYQKGWLTMTFDASMNIKDLHVFSTKKKSEYLYSQYLNDRNDMVFFYGDLEGKGKEKKWNLFVNTFINGKWKQETIPLSSENNFIIPYVAKDGYILLQEFNEKEKFNKIRLERLNY